MKISLILFSLLFAFQVIAKTITGKVFSIHDGDTVTFIPDKEIKKAKLRLLGVDTPEIDFNGMNQGESALIARDFLRSRLPLNAQVTIDLQEKGMDSNNRYLGRLIYNGVDLNLVMLKEGIGALYFIYPYDKKLFATYSEAAKEAEILGLGIFSEKFRNNPLPYIFRQEAKGVPGTNIVGHFSLKKLYLPEDIKKIPAYERVFFSDEQWAREQGFSW